MLTRRALLGAAAGTLASAALASDWRSPFSQTAQAQTIQRGGVLLDSLLSEPESLDPQKSTLLVSSYVENFLYDRLVYWAPDHTPKPWLAESWLVTNGGQTITFKLRRGVQFHDGTPLDAKAVEFTFTRLIDPSFASPNASQIGALTSVKAIDQTTVEMNWSKPFAPVFITLASTTMGILSPAAVQQYGVQFGRTPVGSGPFKLKAWAPGKQLDFERNPLYRNYRGDVKNPGAPYLDGESIALVPEEGTRMAALETGQLMVAWAPIQNVEQIKNDPNLRLYVRAHGASWEYVVFNTIAGPCQDPDLRRAIGYALNPKEILAASYVYADLIQSALPIGTTGYDAKIGAKYGFAYSPQKAQALLRGKQAPPLVLTTWNAPQAVRAAQVMQNELSAVGLTVTIDSMDAGTFLAKLRAQNFQFAFIRNTWQDPSILDAFRSGPHASYSNPKLDAALDQIDSQVDGKKRQVAISAAQQMILQDAAAIPLFSDQFMIATRKEVQGFRFDALGLPMYQDIWIAKG